MYQLFNMTLGCWHKGIGPLLRLLVIKQVVDKTSLKGKAGHIKKAESKQYPELFFLITLIEGGTQLSSFMVIFVFGAKTMLQPSSITKDEILSLIVTKEMLHEAWKLGSV